TWAQSFDIESDSVPGEGKPLQGNAPSVSELVFPSGGDRAFMLLDGVGRAAASRLMASDDGGVTWRDSGQGLPGLGGFRDLVGAPSQASRLYLVVSYNDSLGDNDPAGLSGGLYSSSDGGATWALASRGAQIERLAVDPQSPADVWAVRTTHAVDRSLDSGKTWVTQAISGPSNQRAPWRDIALAHPRGQEATIVLVGSPSRLANASIVAGSIDGGHLFTDLPTDGLGPIAGVTFGNSRTQILFVAGSASTAFRGPGLLAYDLRQQRWRDIDDEQLVSFREPRSIHLDPATRGHPGLNGIELRRDAPGVDPPVPDMIARYTPPDPPPTDDPLRALRKCDPNGDAGQSGAPPSASQSQASGGKDDISHDYTDRPKPAVTFDPADVSLALKPGVPDRLPLTAHLAGVPAPLDVYFLIDSSESMDPAIGGVFCSVDRLARDLQAKGVDAWFGLGTYSDRYQDRYRRLLDLQAYGPQLKQTLDLLFTRRGIEEPIRTGLYQTATGAGLNVEDTYDAGGGTFQSVHVVVPPGRQADYRADALKTVLVIGDEPYDDNTPGEPAKEAVVAELRKRKIRSIGIQVVPPVLDVKTGHVERDPGRLTDRQLVLQQQLRYFASQTGAVGPVGGVDCDGNGTVDVAAGQPLVCPVGEQGVQRSMGDTLEAILKSLKQFEDLRIVPTRTSRLSVSVEGGTATHVNVKDPLDLLATATVSCTATQAGHTYQLAFAVLAGTRTVGTLAGSARCGHQPAPARHPPSHHTVAAPPAPPKASPAIAPPPTPHAAAVAPPPSPPPSPAPISSAPAASPANAPAPASAPAQSPVAAAAAAPETAPAPQAAVVRGNDARGEHAMVALPRGRRDRSPMPAASVMTLGLGALLGAGWMVVETARRRRHPAVARVRSDSFRR
ncbi:MAG: Photosynthesis system assembly factor, partial [Solirubrobacteraceae bacterium]|nr:Photosynthesis system assembly factor [Solirubrobacteraceae bacterium]